jgi:plastocyanin
MNTKLLVLFLMGIAILLSGCSSQQPTTTTSPATTTPSGNNVEIKGSAFNPITITIKKGDTITWTNNDPVTHTVTIPGVTDSGSIPSGQTFSFTFSNAGTFDYHCSIHTSMTGKIIVQ